MQSGDVGQDGGYTYWMLVMWLWLWLLLLLMLFVDVVLLVNVVLSHSPPVEAAVENAMWVFSVVLAWCTREGGSERSERPFPVLLVRLPRLSAQGRE
jgi:hypothetical protein